MEEILIPYNIDNVIIESQDITRLFSKFNIVITPNNIKYYREAMTHKSYILSEYSTIPVNILQEAKLKMPDALDLFTNSNERLEFLGDTVIKCIVSEYLFKRYPIEDEGFMTRLKTKIEDKDSLAKYAKRLAIDHYMIISQQIEDNNGRNSNKLLEDCFEAFMGALFLDLGFELVKKFLTIILETEIDYSELLYKDTNYKDQLLKFYHRNKWSHPIYVEISSEGPTHRKIFKMGVQDFQGNIIGESTEVSKKKAEQKCAMLALYKYNQISKDQMIDIFE